MRIAFTIGALLFLSSAAGQGKLFIIGGGARTQSLINRMVLEASLINSDFIAVLPMASEEPDSALYYLERDFRKATNVDIVSVDQNASPSMVDSLRNAKLIFISGGDQNRFMQAVNGTPITQAIRDAFRRGALIAGTSAGAAVMGERMITGNQRKYPEYNATFERIEQNNLELMPGLNLLPSCVVDQHFIVRSRYNRLVNTVIENPTIMGIGIDESTAILVINSNVEVVGNSQVVVITNPRKSITVKDGKLGGKELKLSIYLPGEKFLLTK